MSLALLVDRNLVSRVLVFGSPPSGGRDLDLLVRPTEQSTLTAVLDAAGLVRSGNQWVDFGERTATGVELVSASAWKLPAEELAELFDAARPLDGFEQLVRPAPAHALLIAARRFTRSRGDVRAKLRTHVESTLAEDPAAWAEAKQRAPAWQASRSLRLLREAQAGKAPHVRRIASGLSEDLAGQPMRRRARAFARLAPRPRRTLVVAFSGLDGAGKSSQARTLHDSLERLGVPTAVVWSPLGGNLTLDLIAVPGRRLLRAAGKTRRERANSSPTGAVMSDPDGARSIGAAGRAVTTAWATLVLLLNALSQRRAVLRHAGRARVVVFDRYALDSIVRARFLYGSSGGSWLQRWIVRRVAPRAGAAFLLEVSAETAWARKSDDWMLEQLARQADIYRVERDRFPVHPVDAEAPAEQIAAEIGAIVWRRLSSGRPNRGGPSIHRRPHRLS